MLSGVIPVFGNPGTGVGVKVTFGVDVGKGVEAGVTLGESVGAGVGVGVGVGVGDTHTGTVIVSVVVETVPPNAKALPVQVMVLPIVIPEASRLIPINVELAPRVVAAVGVQNTLQDDAPLDKVTFEFATEVSAPFILKMYVPPPFKVTPPVPIDAAPDTQYTPGI